VLASVLVAALAALVVWRFGRRVLYRLVGVLERVSDPIARRIHQRGRQQAAR